VSGEGAIAVWGEEKAIGFVGIEWRSLFEVEGIGDRVYGWREAIAV
jgi:hypothetical protein